MPRRRIGLATAWPAATVSICWKDTITPARAPYSMADLAALQKSMLFGADDVAALRQSRAILADQTEAILDVWYGFVASTPELVVFFGDTRSGQPDGAYLAAVRRRFAL